MKRIFTIIFLITAFLTVSKSQLLTLTDSTKFSLLTCSPGPDAYEKFGHTAIRILDESQGVDMIANWGIFDFDKPGFYYKFVKGETYYMLGVHETFYFLESYRRRNSYVIEQVLNLSPDERKRLYDAISVNYLPENREYLYNFVFDNCATRPRELINQIVKPKTIEAVNEIEYKSFRDWVGAYTGKYSWLQFGIDLVFGRDADEYATPYQAMFLPEVLYKSYDGAKIVDPSGTETPFISEEWYLVEKRDELQKSTLFSKPIFVTVLMLLIGLIITFWENKKKKQYKIFDFLLLLITGIAGLIVFYLMFFSIHPLVKSNFNLLWCNPLNIIASVLLFTRKIKKILKGYFLIYFVMIVVAFIVAVLKVQIFNIAFLPVMGLILVRILYWFKFQKIANPINDK